MVTLCSPSTATSQKSQSKWGRKFGLGLMVISQRPARIDKNILSQCNTQIIMKMTNPNDLKAISKGLEGISSEVEEELKRLPPGVSLLVSNDIELPVLVDVRVRKSKHGGGSVNIVQSASSRHSMDVEKSNTLKPSSFQKPPQEEIHTEKIQSSGLFKKLFGSRKS